MINSCAVRIDLLHKELVDAPQQPIGAHDVIQPSWQ